MSITLFNRRDQLDDLIDSLLNEMAGKPEESEEYKVLLRRLERLSALRDKKTPSKLDRNTIALIAGNLLGILIIVAYEQRHVMTSKGFGEIIKPKYLPRTF